MANVDESYNKQVVNMRSSQQHLDVPITPLYKLQEIGKYNKIIDKKNIECSLEIILHNIRKRLIVSLSLKIIYDPQVPFDYVIRRANNKSININPLTLLNSEYHILSWTSYNDLFIDTDRYTATLESGIELLTEWGERLRLLFVQHRTLNIIERINTKVEIQKINFRNKKFFIMRKDETIIETNINLSDILDENGYQEKLFIIYSDLTHNPSGIKIVRLRLVSNDINYILYIHDILEVDNIILPFLHISRNNDIIQELEYDHYIPELICNETSTGNQYYSESNNRFLR